MTVTLVGTKLPLALDIRGRILRKSRNGAEVGAITIKDKPGKSYILRVYNADTKECSMYIQIWNIWWGRCNEDKKLLQECISCYENYKLKLPKVENKAFIDKIRTLFIEVLSGCINKLNS